MRMDIIKVYLTRLLGGDAIYAKFQNRGIFLCIPSYRRSLVLVLSAFLKTSKETFFFISERVETGDKYRDSKIVFLTQF